MALGRGLSKKGSRPSLDRDAEAATSSSGRPRRSPSIRNQISAPVALISTTNMISYTSPSLRTSRSSLSTNSSSSSSSSPTTAAFPPSPSSDEDDSTLPASNHLSTYFTAAPLNVKRSQSTRTPPSIPIPPKSHRRVPSMPPGISRSDSRKTAWPSAGNNSALHASQSMPLRARASTQGPSSLAKMAGIPEVPALPTRQADPEEMWLVEHGLQKYSARDYECDLMANPWGGVFEDNLSGGLVSAGWI